MSTPENPLFQPLTLPNGTVIPNRLAKAAMEENLSELGQAPGEGLVRAYTRWAEGGAGLLLTGNVMIAPEAMTGPGGVLLQEGTNLDPFRRWAEAGKSGGGKLWMQISHPGRQIYAAMGVKTVSASDVALDLGKFSNMFPQPRALEEAEIQDIIDRFAMTAALAEEAGFDGAQIHAAHGYLVSQFLSPLANKRTDQWGGALENRARLLLEIIKAVRERVEPTFSVAVKLNSADFQRGGFDFEDAKQVISWLNELPVDLVELSGGSYESPAMQGNPQEGSTGAREAYFIDFARDIGQAAKMPIMVTGGIKRFDVAEAALQEDEHGFGVAMLGIGRALCVKPDLPNAWLRGQDRDVVVPEAEWKNKTLAGLANMALAKKQIWRMAAGKSPRPKASPLFAMIYERMRTNKLTKRYKKWMAQVMPQALA